MRSDFISGVIFWLSFYVQPTKVVQKNPTATTKGCISIAKLGSPTATETLTVTAKDAIVIWAVSTKWQDASGFCNYAEIQLSHTIYSGTLPLKQISQTNEGIMLYNFSGQIITNFWGPNTGTTHITTYAHACQKAMSLGSSSYYNDGSDPTKKITC